MTQSFPNISAVGPPHALRRILEMPDKTIIIKRVEPFEGPIRVVVTVCPNCGQRLMMGMTKCPGCSIEIL
jgi:hypothetical protein